MTKNDENQPDVEPVEGFDETNGLAGNLEGDDGGAEPEERTGGSLLGDILNNGLHLTPHDEDERHDQGYGDEGHA